jgi:hypothetical protein
MRQIKFFAAAAAAEWVTAAEEIEVVTQTVARSAVDEFTVANGAAQRW